VIKQKVSILFVSSVLLFQQCSSPTNPLPEKPPKDPRTYEWTIDTLKISFQTNLRRIWGSAPNDVYIGGHNIDAYKPGNLWHFDGDSLVPVELPAAVYSVNGIYGFSSSNVWVVGETATSVSLILNYDGTKWKDYSSNEGKALLCIWGSTPKNIWACGRNTLFHFNGSSWSTFHLFNPVQGIQFTSLAGLSANDVYMPGYRNDVVPPVDTTFYYLYHFDGSQWSVMDSSYVTPYDDVWNFGFIVKAIGSSMYSAGYRMFKKEEGSWVIINDDPLIFSLGGSSSENIFAAGLLGAVYQYNGTDWKKLTIKEGFRENIFDVWTDGTEAFMIASDGYQSFFIHGK
jgi:hypothetical protein